MAYDLEAEYRRQRRKLFWEDVRMWSVVVAIILAIAGCTVLYSNATLDEQHCYYSTKEQYVRDGHGFREAEWLASRDCHWSPPL